MNVLIVEGDPDIAGAWVIHLERAGYNVSHANTQSDAVAFLQQTSFEIIVLNLILEEGSVLAIPDFASYRCPRARVIFVTGSSFFSDGWIFHHSANACALLPRQTAPEDLAMMVDHYARAN